MMWKILLSLVARLAKLHDDFKTFYFWTWALMDIFVTFLQHKACPYYVTRFLLPNADIIFCPYNYMIDPNIRKSVSFEIQHLSKRLYIVCKYDVKVNFWQMGLELEGHVLIFDEAHNMEDAARESSNISLKQDEIQRTMQDCEKVGRLGNEPYAHSEIVNYHYI